MIYDLSRHTDKDRFKRRCNALYLQGSRVELTEKKDRRTLPQNAYLHLILGWFAIEVGHRLEFVKQEYFKRYINSDIFVVEIVDKHLGKISVLRSSRDVDSAEMTTAIERFRTWASQEAGIYLPSPDERDFLREIETEIYKNHEYL